MQKEDLHLLINEEIYVIGEAQHKQGSSSSVDNTNIVPVAFIHNTDDREELELLSKIIAACNLSSKDYKIFKEGEDEPFEKGIIFTESADIYYQVTTGPIGQVINSKPLSILKDSKDEKTKLWEVLKVLSK